MATLPARNDFVPALISTLFSMLVVSLCCVTGCSSRNGESDATQPEVERIKTGDNDFWLGRSAFRRGEYQKAITLLEASRTKPLEEYSKQEVFLTLGKAHWGIGKLEKAIEYYDEALKLDPNLVDAMISRGVAYQQLKKYDQAEASYQQALLLKPDNIKLRNSIGALAIVQEDYSKAVEQLELATELDPSFAVAFSNLALAYAHLGFYKKAQRKLEQAGALGYPKFDVIQAKIDKLKIAEIRQNSPQQDRNPLSKSSLPQQKSGTSAKQK